MTQTASSIQAVPRYRHKCVGRLVGHVGKVYGLRMSRDGTELASVGQDGFAIVWDAAADWGKRDVIMLHYPFALTVALSPSGRLLATGSLDNSTCIYRVERDGPLDGTPSGAPNATATPSGTASASSSRRQTPSFTPRLPLSMLKGHRAFVAATDFLSEDRLVTASGDMSVSVWDVATSRPVASFFEHLGAVNCIARSPLSPNVFATASTDCTVKVWDVRQQTSLHSFGNHAADVGALSFFPDGNVVASASEDGTLCLSDIRTDGPIDVQRLDAAGAGPVSALCFSPSGRLLNVGYDNGSVGTLDILKCQWVSSLQGHSQSISAVCVGSDSIFTASWDGDIRAWQPSG